MIFVGLDATMLDRKNLKKGIAQAMKISEARIMILTLEQVPANGKVRGRYLLSEEQNRAVQITFSVVSESMDVAEIIQTKLAHLGDTASSKSAWTSELQSVGLPVSDMFVVGDVAVSPVASPPLVGQQPAKSPPPMLPPLRTGGSKSILDRKRDLALYVILPCAIAFGIAITLICVLRAASARRGDGERGRSTYSTSTFDDQIYDSATTGLANFDLGSYNPMRGPALTLAGGLNPLVGRTRQESSMELSQFFAPSSSFAVSASNIETTTTNSSYQVGSANNLTSVSSPLAYDGYNNHDDEGVTVNVRGGRMQSNLVSNPLSSGQLF